MRKATDPVAIATPEVKQMIDNLLSHKSSWETFKETKLPIVLYGTGLGADKVIDEFERLGIKLSEVIASEGFVRDRFFRGYKVKSLGQIEAEYEDFIIALGFATCIPQIIEDIKAIAEKHKVLVPVVPVFGYTIMNRPYIEEHKDVLLKSRELLFDEESVRVFDNMMMFQFTGELSFLFSIESNRSTALSDILKLNNKEHMLDLGAYRGDTIEELINLTGGYASITALEPDKKTFDKLSSYLQDKPNTCCLPYAVWSENTELTFCGGGGRQSTLSPLGRYAVPAVSADSITRDKTITYVKADVEGAEKEMLLGMKKLLQTQKPKLSISCYHKTEDLCTLIPLIHSINPEYKIHLRHHPYIPCWDTDLYCI